MAAVALATRWQDIQGINNWKGLIEPLHPELREAGIRYGEFVEALYDAIDMENESEYVYYSLFGKSKLFDSVGIKQRYVVTKYLYSTLLVSGWGRLFGFKEQASTVWLGYIAVSTDEETKRIGRRDVAVIFRGTKAKNENWINSHINMVEFKELGEPFPKVMSGFLSMYTSKDPSKMFGGLSIREQIFKELNRLIEIEHKKEDMSITFVGHSMGAGIAPLAAADFGVNISQPVDQDRTVMVTAFVFGAPMCGDRVFKERAEKACKVIRLVDTGDPVVIIPPAFLGYEHVGVEWRVNWADSPYVQDLGWIPSMRCHNLELYLHCLAGQKKEAEAKVGTMSMARSVRALIQEDPDLADDAEVEIPEDLKSFKDAFKDEPQTLQKFVKEQAAIVKASRRSLNNLRRINSRDDEQPSQKRLKTTIMGSIGPNSEISSSSSSFEMVVKRDFALMNKSDNIVAEELGIPQSWWVHGFKNLRKIDDEWLPRNKWPAEDIPREDNPEFN